MSGFRLKSAFWTYYLSTMGPHRGRPYYHPNGGIWASAISLIIATAKQRDQASFENTYLLRRAKVEN